MVNICKGKRKQRAERLKTEREWCCKNVHIPSQLINLPCLIFISMRLIECD